MPGGWEMMGGWLAGQGVARLIDRAKLLGWALVLLLFIGGLAVAYFNGVAHGRSKASIEMERAKTRAAQELAAAQAAHSQALASRIARIKELEDEQAKRETVYRAELGALHTSSSGLRQQIAELQRKLPAAAAANPVACAQAASATAELLGNCAAEYRELAAAAGGHADDLRAAYAVTGQALD